MSSPARQDAPSASLGVLVYAERYAALGWSVFPVHSVCDGQCTCANESCEHPGKHPRTRHGFKDATTDLKRIRRWADGWRSSNVGVATGSTSGLVVIDIDDERAFEVLAEQHGTLPDTVEQHTGRGRQLFFRYPDGVTISNKTALGGHPGVDVRGDGGYVVAPPSRHVTGKSYVWELSSDPTDGVQLAELPPAWLARLTEPAIPQTPTAGEGDANVLREGQRNDGLFRLASSMRAKSMSQKAIAAALLAENEVRCHPPLREREVRTIAKSAGQYEPGAGKDAPVCDTWPDSQPLPDELPSVVPFDFDLLPSSLRPWIKDIAERVQCPPDFPAVAAMIALATVVGRKVGIRPKLHDDWLVVPNLWGAAIGPPSVMKTPAIQEALRPLKRLEIDAKREFDEVMKEFIAQQLVAEQRRNAAKIEIRKALSDPEGNPQKVARDAITQDAARPTRRRFMVNDSTVEKLGEILNENPNGALIYRDELIGLLKSLEKEGQEGARSFYLEAWNGTGLYTYDRIGRGTIDIEAAIVSLIGSIQPGPLRSYLLGAVSGNQDADGLMQRFQLAVYPDISTTWRNVDRLPNTDSKKPSSASATGAGARIG